VCTEGLYPPLSMNSISSFSFSIISFLGVLMAAPLVRPLARLLGLFPRPDSLLLSLGPGPFPFHGIRHAILTDPVQFFISQRSAASTVPYRGLLRLAFRPPREGIVPNPASPRIF
jgi:hypothetical protein